MANDIPQAESHTLQAPDLPKYPAGSGKGRPTTYTPATAQLICMRLCDGELLSDICRTPGMPTRQTVHSWRMRIPAFDDLYYRARAVGMESMSDDTLAIADDDTLDTLPDGSPNHVNVNRARLQIHARHFLMGKLSRDRYGERQTVEHTGAVTHTVELSDRERMRRLATYLAEDQAAGRVIEHDQPATLPSLTPARPASVAEIEPGGIDEPRVRDDDV